jgi:hypothetical protein
VIHYHGTPITPRARLLELAGRCFCVSFAQPQDIAHCHEIGQSVMLDNGAYSLWRTGRATDWPGYYRWCERWLEYPTTWAVIPDLIEGTEQENDALIAAWPHGPRGAPVWHMHESLNRLLRLAEAWPRVCIGSSREYRSVGDRRWHECMTHAMDALCGDGPVPIWLHLLRGLKLSGGAYPFASADSTNIARNHAGVPSKGVPRRNPRVMADKIDGLQCPSRWEPHPGNPSPVIQ